VEQIEWLTGAGFQSSVPYTEILFFTVISSLRPEKWFRFFYRDFHRSWPVFFGKCSGSLREGFGISRRLPEETSKKPRKQPVWNPGADFVRNDGQTAPKSLGKKFPYTVPNSEIRFPGAPIFVEPAGEPPAFYGSMAQHVNT
jgi:hypothetical protein